MIGKKYNTFDNIITLKNYFEKIFAKKLQKILIAPWYKK